MKEILKVKSSSSVSGVAGAVVKSLENDSSVTLHAIGAGAVNQAVKAIASAQGILATKGESISTKFGFDTIQIDDKERTLIKFKVEVE